MKNEEKAGLVQSWVTTSLDKTGFNRQMIGCVAWYWKDGCCNLLVYRKESSADIVKKEFVALYTTQKYCCQFQSVLCKTDERKT